MGLSDLRQIADMEENGLRQNSEYRWCEIREQRIHKLVCEKIKEPRCKRVCEFGKRKR